MNLNTLLYNIRQSEISWNEVVQFDRELSDSNILQSSFRIEVLHLANMKTT